MTGRADLVHEVAQLVDRAARNRIVVFGSLPPGGRDLDLLVHGSDAVALATALRREGLAERGGQFVAFRSGAAYAVELVPAPQLGLAPAELGLVFAHAVPLAGFERLSQPSAYHRLLLLAYVVLPGSSGLSPSRAERVRLALVEDPDAWDRAAARAPAWGDPAVLDRLKAVYRWGPDRWTRARRRLPRPWRGAVVALSGIDGAGKSHQAVALEAVLTDLGWEVAVVWLPLGQNATLHRVAQPVKRLLARRAAGGHDHRADGGQPGSDPSDPPTDPGTALRQRSRLVSYGWSAVVAAANGLTHLRRSAPHLLAGRVVIFDRYILDSTVRLRFSYGEDRPFRLQRWLIWALSPRPRCAFFLDVAAETSVARKQDRWHLDELRRHAELYRAEFGRHGARRLDAERDAEVIGAEIAETVWRALA